MSLALISLNFYDDNDEIIETHEKSVVRWGVMKKAIRLAKSLGKDTKDMDVDDFEEEEFDKISEFVCEVFNNKFSTQQLEDNADMTEVLSVFQAVINKANSMNVSPNR